MRRLIRAVLLVLALVMLGAAAARSPEPSAPGGDRIEGRITDVTDGDTVRVQARGAARRTYVVRLIGIDTPETRKPGVGVECGGREATSRMLALAFSAPVDTDGDALFDEQGGRGRRVTLQTDATQDRVDRYGRLLAYVGLAGRGRTLQRRMLASGWATTYVYGDTPFVRAREFRAVERRARAAERGVHRKCGGDFHSEQ
jgi:micrococcal nuclease